MTRPLNDDGSFPLRRRVQVVLRVVEGDERILLETHQDVDLRSRQDDRDHTVDHDQQADDSTLRSSREDANEHYGRVLARRVIEKVPSLARELTRLAQDAGGR